MTRTALVTGAAKGIGRAAALELARCGYRVCVHYNTSRARAEKTAEEVREAFKACCAERAESACCAEGSALGCSAGPAGTACVPKGSADGSNSPEGEADPGSCVMLAKADLSDPEEVRTLAESFLSCWGAPDLIVNNAGVSLVAQIQDVSESDWDRVMGSNLKSDYAVIKAFVPAMVERGSGCIINVSSMWGEVGGSCEAVYSASKGGVIALTKALAKELGPSGIRVNCVSPGCIKTDMLSEFSEETLKSLAEDTPLGRLGEPGDVAKAIAFLASDGASFITGQVLGVNGGMVI